MARNPAFGRLRPSDRLRAWWDARNSTFRSDAILFLVVGSISVGLVWSAVSRDQPGRRSVATAARPSVTVPGSVTTPTSLDLRTVSVGPLPLPGAEPSTSTTAVQPVAGPTMAAAAAGPAPQPVTTPPSPATTVPNPAVVFTEAPVSPPTSQVTPGSTVPPPTTLPATTAPPTTPPSTTSPPTTAPPTRAPPTTAGTLLPPLSLPPLLD